MKTNRIEVWGILGLAMLTLAPPAVSLGGDPIFADGFECGIDPWSLTCTGGNCTAGSGEPCCVSAPRVVYVDPPVSYNGFGMTVEAYAAELSGSLVSVSLYPTGQPAQSQALSFTIDPDEPNRVHAVVPAGLSAGAYTLAITDEMSCQGEQLNALTVVESTTVAIERVEASFGWNSAPTRVEVYSPGSPPPGQSNFAATPRLFLSPAVADPASTATELRLTSFVSPLRLSTVVTAGLAVGPYDLLAINPDGGVGLLEDAFEVTAAEPPLIRDLIPSTIPNYDTRFVSVAGENFSMAGTVTMSCRQPDSSQVLVPTTIEDLTPTAIDISFNLSTTTVADGSLCGVRVTNGDGSYADSPVLAIVDYSLIPSGFSSTPPLLTARRALCGAAGEATDGTRFVYAIGGDDGTARDSAATTRFASIEVAPIGPYGDLGSFSEQAVQLPTPLSFHGCAQLGRAIYVVGGNDGSSAVATAYRAEILDPDAAPMILEVDLNVIPDAAPQLASGMYSYRVSAVIGVGDAHNPGGETLAGDALLVHVPDSAEELTVSLSWSAVSGAAAYRIYRTPTANLAAGSEVLLLEQPAALSSFTDDGSLVAGSDTPLSLGSTGEFVALPSMMIAREGAGVVLTGDPSASNTFHLYALGGRDDTQTALDTLEWLDITVGADGAQTAAAAWTAGSATIGDPRWQLQGSVADVATAAEAVTGNEIWVYALGGLTANTTLLINDVVGMRVATNGALGEGIEEWWEVDGMLPFRAGYSTVLRSSSIYVFGGNQGSPDINGSYTEICGNDLGTCSGGASGAPDLMNWNNLGIDMSSARYLSGDAVFGPFVFILGGLGQTWTPQATTDRIVW